LAAFGRFFFAVCNPLWPALKRQKTPIPKPARAGPLRMELRMTDARNEGSADLLYGLAAIGAHLEMTARQVEHLVTKGELPTFKLGRTVCARRSTLAKHFAAQEAAAREASHG
jgi:hypothetical protein